VPVKSAAILVDQKYGEEILADANRRGITTCVSVEKSGQDEFDFEYADNFGQRLQDANPTFAKVLVRYNPDGDAEVNKNQCRRLKVFSDYTHWCRPRRNS
jgi:myo-inositol catabolism protein IolC